MMKKKKVSSYERIRARCGYMFISLWLVGFVIFFLLPFVTSVIYSFNSVKVEIGEVKLTPVGFDNYIGLFLENEEFLPAFTSTLGSVVTQTPLIIIFSLFIAIILNQKFRGRTLARMVFFLPVVIAGGVVMDIISGSQFLNLAMSGGREEMMFEASSVYDILMTWGFNHTLSEYIANMVNSVFQLAWNSGIQILLFLSGLQSINPSLYEVAKVEGASAWVAFWKITLPMIAPTIAPIAKNLATLQKAIASMPQSEIDPSLMEQNTIVIELKLGENSFRLPQQEVRRLPKAMQEAILSGIHGEITDVEAEEILDS